MSSIRPYIKIARPDHWIKQLFILPGVALAVLLGDMTTGEGSAFDLVFKVVFAFAATSLIASANYVINEWLDREFDQFHPVKKNRPAVIQGLHASIVYSEWLALTVLGGFVASRVSLTCFISVAETSQTKRNANRNLAD